MAYSKANGAMPSSQLTTVERGMKLRNDTAKAYLAMKAEARRDGYSYFGIAYDAGAYRSLWLQRDMHTHPAAHNLSKASSVSIAAPGLSSHGTGDRVDLIGAPLSYIIALAGRYGFKREFGGADPNHFQDHHTWRAPVKVAKTGTILTGSPGPAGTACWKRVQLLARKGGYTGAIDGKLGTASWKGVQQALKAMGLYHGEIDGAPAQLTFIALQVWAGVKTPDRVSSWKKISKVNWRKIAVKLNRL